MKYGVDGQEVQKPKIKIFQGNCHDRWVPVGIYSG